MYKQYYRYKLILIIADFWITLSVLLLVEHIRPSLPGEQVGIMPLNTNWWFYFFSALLFHVLFSLSGVYDYKRMPHFFIQITRLTFSSLLGIWVFSGILFFTNRETSRLLVIYFTCTNYLVLIAYRYLLWRILKTKQHLINAAPLLIIGVNETSDFLAKHIANELGSVFNLVGFVDFESPENVKLPASFLGYIEDVPQIVRDNKIEVIIITARESHDKNMEDLVQHFIHLPVRIYIAPHYAHLALVEAELDQIGNMVLIGIREPVIHGAKRFSKRIMDIAISVVLFLLTWPFFIVIWITIKIDSEGPGIFAAPRVGEGGKIFKMYKFRTMIVGAEKLQHSVTTFDQHGNELYKVKDDQRITKVGRWLRRTSLDELPQLFNVLRGEMSLVGPRPEQPFVTEKYQTWQWQRVLVPPGVTGWWQISGRSDLPMHLNTNYDVYYVRNYSIFLDLKILMRTLIEVLKGRGAY